MIDWLIDWLIESIFDAVTPNQRVSIILTLCWFSWSSVNVSSFIGMNNRSSERLREPPELRSILGFDWQLRDIATFCTDPLQMSVFGADPTFNLGRFNVTVTSLQNLKLVNRVNGHHPTMIGPMLLSQTKSFDSYNQFFGKIVSLDKGTRGILAFGTDGEDELYKAMKFSFPHALHLRCFNHFRDNCKDKLFQKRYKRNIFMTYLGVVLVKSGRKVCRSF